VWVLAERGVCSSVECVFLNMKTRVIGVEGFQEDYYVQGRDIVEAFIKSTVSVQASGAKGRWTK